MSLSAQTARRNALRGISDKKARGDHKELCSQYDRCVGIFADLSKNSSAISNARRSTVSKAAMSVPSSIATRPARLMPGPSLRPTAWPTLTAAAMLMPKAIMDVIMVI